MKHLLTLLLFISTSVMGELLNIKLICNGWTNNYFPNQEKEAYKEERVYIFEDDVLKGSLHHKQTYCKSDSNQIYCWIEGKNSLGQKEEFDTLFDRLTGWVTSIKTTYENKNHTQEVFNAECKKTQQKF